jgi:hypothetical protein
MDASSLETLVKLETLLPPTFDNGQFSTSEINALNSIGIFSAEEYALYSKQPPQAFVYNNPSDKLKAWLVIYIRAKHIYDEEQIDILTSSMLSKISKYNIKHDYYLFTFSIDNITIIVMIEYDDIKPRSIKDLDVYGEEMPNGGGRIKSKWVSTGTKVTLMDGSKRVIFRNMEKPQEMRIRRMILQNNKKVATYIKVKQHK